MVVIVRALGLRGEHQAGAHRDAVEQHGAGAADAVLAAGMRALEVELVAQAIEQRGARLDLERRARVPLTLSSMRMVLDFLALRIGSASATARAASIAATRRR